MALLNKDFLENCKTEGDQIICNFEGRAFQCNNQSIAISEKTEMLKCSEKTSFHLVKGIRDDHPHKVSFVGDAICFGNIDGKNTVCQSPASQILLPKAKTATSIDFQTMAHDAKTDQNLKRFVENFSLLGPKQAEGVSLKINQVLDKALQKTFLR